MSERAERKWQIKARQTSTFPSFQHRPQKWQQRRHNTPERIVIASWTRREFFELLSEFSRLHISSLMWWFKALLPVYFILYCCDARWVFTSCPPPCSFLARLEDNECKKCLDMWIVILIAFVDFVCFVVSSLFLCFVYVFLLLISHSFLSVWYNTHSYPPPTLPFLNACTQS